jgi:dihydrofolate reductase
MKGTENLKKGNSTMEKKKTRKITVFNNVSIDGYFSGPNGEIDWFKVAKDPEYERVTHKMAKSGGSLMFGRTTYEMMKSYWTSPDAIKNDPGMAQVVNNSPKIVFSKTLKNVEEDKVWKNVTVLNEINPEEIFKLKMQEGKNITILGSGTIVQRLTDLALIDEYMLVVNPVVLGVGRNLFKDVKKIRLKLIESRVFKNWIVWLRYQP